MTVNTHDVHARGVSIDCVARSTLSTATRGDGEGNITYSLVNPRLVERGVLGEHSAAAAAVKAVLEISAVSRNGVATGKYVSLEFVHFPFEPDVVYPFPTAPPGSPVFYFLFLTVPGSHWVRAPCISL